MKKLNSFVLAALLLTVSLGINAQKKEGGKIGGIRFGYHSAALYDNGDIVLRNRKSSKFLHWIFQRQQAYSCTSSGHWPGIFPEWRQG